jgi:anti-sigma factor RsiW
MKNPDSIGWKIPALYGDELVIVPVDVPRPSGAVLEIGAADTIGGSVVSMNRTQVAQLVADLKEYLDGRDWQESIDKRERLEKEQAQS